MTFSICSRVNTIISTPVTQGITWGPQQIQTDVLIKFTLITPRASVTKPTQTITMNATVYVTATDTGNHHNKITTWTTISIMGFSSFPAWDDFFHRQQSEYNYKHTSNPRHHLGTSADSNWCAYKIHFDYTKSFSDKANADDYNECNGICNSDWHRLPSQQDNYMNHNIYHGFFFFSSMRWLFPSAAEWIQL